MTKPLTTPVLVARDIILGILRHRLNLTLTETVARDAANNAAQALMDLLAPIPSDEPPPVRNIPSSICTHPVTEADGKCGACGDVTDWRDAPEVKAIR